MNSNEYDEFRTSYRHMMAERSLDAVVEQKRNIGTLLGLSTRQVQGLVDDLKLLEHYKRHQETLAVPRKPLKEENEFEQIMEGFWR